MLKRNYKHIATALLMLPVIGLASCSGGNAERSADKAYAAALKDSIRNIQAEIDSCDRNLDILRDNQDVWLRDFTTVANSREAAPYMIYTPFKEKYPPTETGLIARLAENGQLELIASLRGARFDQIAVTADMETVTSDVVSPDQALNYFADGLNTVMFTGPKADMIGHLIADNELNPITVSFINGKPVKAMKLPEEYSKMISTTFELYNTQKQIAALERRVPMLHRKIDLLRSHLDKTEQRDSTGNR